ncbi:hypothetical protein [Streptomyces sp. NPDC088727]|uniref:hypothetical protein n=1 Tax=Streptomyces sp. NPDC088727 TaxID=3365875 RepID=UPI00381B6A33
MTFTIWLIPFTGEPVGRCPKCLTKPVMTEYHDSVVVGMCKEKRDIIVAMADDPANVPDETTEHLCRGCPLCGFVWSEYVASPEDLARARAMVATSD